MYVRLAFAVAAHLESEILIVDEVLAVGDSQFQQKCLGKMGAVSQDGRTVLFVSHNIDAIRTLCTSAVLLKSGSFVAAGGVQPIVNQYLASVRQSSRSGAGVWHTPEPRIGVNTVRVIQRGIESSQLICGESFELRIDVKLDETCSDLEIGFGFRDEEGRDILCVNNKHVDQTVDWPRHGDFEVVIHVPQLNWIHGTEVSLGIYFGYVNGRYQALEDIMFLRLSKEFQVLSPAKLTPRENKIFIDGLNFTGASSDSSQFAAISAP
jgi:lipopolysaccharide transport system ATP-binding protein